MLKLPVDRYIVISEATREKLLAHGVKPERIVDRALRLRPGGRGRGRSRRSGDDASEPSAPSIVDGVAAGGLQACRSRRCRRSRCSPIVTPTCGCASSGKVRSASRLETLARELGVADRVDFLGFVPSHDDVMKEIATASVFVSASEIEGFGISVVEAAAVDVPFVITDMPGLPRGDPRRNGRPAVRDGRRGGSGREDRPRC